MKLNKARDCLRIASVLLMAGARDVDDGENQKPTVMTIGLVRDLNKL